MTPATPRLLPVLPAVSACALVLGLSVLSPSTSRILVWPWAGFAAAGWLFAFVTVFYRIAAGRPHARFGGLIDAGFAVLALAAVASAFVSPISGAILPQVLPFLGICSLPYLLLPWLHAADADTTRRFHLLSIGLCLLILITSLLLWLDPGNGFSGWSARNTQPFGHSNTTGSFAVLAATWLIFSALTLAGRARWVALVAAGLSITAALSSQSRGAVLALAVVASVFGAVQLLSRRRYLAFAVLGVVIVGGALGTNQRLRDLVLHQRWSDGARESNQQRTAMILGGIALGNERPLLGWGAGSVPHVFPRVRAALPGTADNFLHLHNTPAQLWAALGGAGLIGGLLLAAGIAARLRAAPWTPARTILAAGIAGGATVLLFDHPFAAPAFAFLTAAHLSAWAVPAPAATTRPARLASGLGLLAALAIVPSSLRDLAARAAYSASLDDASDGSAALTRAMSLAPADPYYAHQYASFLFTHSSDPAAAVPALRATLLHNPDLEYAHYNLGWLLLDSAPAEAAAHFRTAARLAPQRGGVYFGLGLARLNEGDSPAALRAFATECLHDPAFFWSPEWRSPVLAGLRPAVLALLTSAPLPVTAASTGLREAWSLATPPLADGLRFRRVRTGYGVLLGHPDGPAPADVNVQFSIQLPPALAGLVPPKGWLPGPFLIGFLASE